MSRATNRLKILKEITGSNTGEFPLHIFLKKYFRAHRSMGSTDRRVMSSLVYGWYRIGRSVDIDCFEDRVIVSGILLRELHHDWAVEIMNEVGEKKVSLNDYAEKSIESRIEFVKSLYSSFNPDKIVDLHLQLSGDLTNEALGMQMLQIPKIFIRVKPDKSEDVISEFEKHEITFHSVPEIENIISVETRFNLKELDAFKLGYFEIQDRSSQIAGSLIQLKGDEKVWDCCCGSGGKSIQLKTKFPGLKITASDIRSSIITNFKQRTSRYPQFEFQAEIKDILASGNAEVRETDYDLVLVDVPCTGSGTWARHPENLVFFKKDDINKYLSDQKQILKKVAQTMKKGANLAYITCSVFRSENEDITEYITEKLDLQCNKMEVIDGTQHFSDSMFYASFSKP